MSRCSGHCCSAFRLPFAPDELRERAAGIADGAFIADMVIPLGPPADDLGGYRYSCRHLVGGDCAVYDARPRMCRDYPYGRRCVERGCTLDTTSAPPSPWTFTDAPDLDRIPAGDCAARLG